MSHFQYGQQGTSEAPKPEENVLRMHPSGLVGPATSGISGVRVVVHGAIEHS